MSVRRGSLQGRGRAVECAHLPLPQLPEGDGLALLRPGAVPTKCADGRRRHRALCHLAKTNGAGGSKYCCVSALGPDLSDRFANLAADEEKAFKDIILNGGPTYMPSWKYALTAEEIDDIIAYLKTLKR